jgi:hypothetical protein
LLSGATSDAGGITPIAIAPAFLRKNLFEEILHGYP